MKINVTHVNEPSLDALQERFYAAADSAGIDREEALRQALVQGMRSMGIEVPQTTMTATEKELAWMRATLAVMRERP